MLFVCQVWMLTTWKNQWLINSLKPLDIGKSWGKLDREKLWNECVYKRTKAFKESRERIENPQHSVLFQRLRTEKMAERINIPIRNNLQISVRDIAITFNISVSLTEIMSMLNYTNIRLHVSDYNCFPYWRDFAFYVFESLKY